MTQEATRQRVAFFGRSKGAVPTVQIALKYVQGDKTLATFIQKTINFSDLAQAQCHAEELMRQGRVKAVLPL